ncbi:Vinorine synthase [Nymphaea thermarum]|nr:Vinorine synthase [Nymphaea thermarum]
MAGDLQMQAMQTVVPAKATEPGLRHLIDLSGRSSRELFTEHISIIFYYKQMWEPDKDGLILGGWMKDSLTIALPHLPVLAGRVDAEDHYAVKCNDAGVRLVSAQANCRLKDWQEGVAKNKNMEAQLAYWKDVDNDHPQNSPLCYVQVTNFQGEEFSIGISCSLLVADPLILTNFIKTWSEHHLKVAPKSNDLSKLPLFYRPIIRKSILSNALKAPCGYPNYETVVFKLSGANMKRLSMVVQDGRCVTGHVDPLEVLASLCYDKAKQNYAGEASAAFSLFSSKDERSKKVSLCLTAEDSEGLPKEQSDISKGLTATNWDALSPYEVDFQGNSKPVRVSYLIEPFYGEGVVIIMGSGDDTASDRFISVTVPQNKI